MKFCVLRLLTVTLLVRLAIVAGACSGQTYQQAIGYTDLVAEYGAALETGVGIRAFMAEAASGGNYLPNAGHAEFAGKTITNGTIPPATGTTGHATSVGRYFFGNSTSIAPGITDITSASADDFVNRYTGYATLSDPLPQGFHVANHSYIGTFAGYSEKLNLLRRFDYIINRDNTIVVVGANNGSNDTAPDAWAHSYNAITVGRSDGNHSYGSTTGYGAGRTTPDIVVPMQFTSNNFTSFATPVVGASAAILLEAAGFDEHGNSLRGGRNQVIRALLFAGATKNEFPSWNKTTTRPVDSVYGFGQLNIYNSYQMLQAGEHSAFQSGDKPSSNLGSMGWNYGNYSDGYLYYNFEIAPGEQLAELSAVLTWNVDVWDSNPNPAIFTPQHQLANLDLELFKSSDAFLGTLIQSSLSTAYNYEHIYLTNPLAAGKYTFRIAGNMPVDYGFAWRISTRFATAPEPSTLLTVALALAGLVHRRRRAR